MFATCRAAILSSLLFTFPAVAILALAFRFPIPFAGYASGVSAVLPALAAALFYGLCGGVIVQAAMGFIAGIAAWRRNRDDRNAAMRSAWLFGTIAAWPGPALLSILDWFVGPW